MYTYGSPNINGIQSELDSLNSDLERGSWGNTGSIEDRIKKLEEHLSTLCKQTWALAEVVKDMKS